MADNALDDIPAFLRIPAAERRAAWARFDVARQTEAEMKPPGPKEVQLRSLRQQQDETRRVKSRGRIEKLKAKLAGDLTKVPAQGKDALAVIAAQSTEGATMNTLDTTASASAESETTKPVAAKPAGAKKPAAKKGAKGAAKKKAKPASAAKPKAKAKKPAAAAKDGDSKTAVAAKLLRRANGCTGKDILESTGWPTVSVPGLAKSTGLKLRKEKKPGELTRYYGTPI